MAHGHAEELTGGRRYRKRIYSSIPEREPSLVLQVEVSYWDYDKHKWMTKWRDATSADLPSNQVI